MNDKYQRFYWNVRFTTESSFDLSKYMRHTSKVGRARPAQRRPFKSENTVVFVQFYGRGPCCDVNLDGDHLYQANTFVTHNTLNFEIIYGVGAKTLALQLGIKDSAAQSMIDGWFRAYPRVRLWMDSGTAEAKRIGYGRTLAGRYRWPDKGRITGARGRSAQGEEERTFANSRVQGSAADMTSQSMLLLRKDRLYLGTGARIIAQVHDEVVVESPWTQADLVMERMRILMEQPFSAPLRVPMPVSIGVGPSWATSKLLKAVVVV